MQHRSALIHCNSAFWTHWIYILSFTSSRFCSFIFHGPYFLSVQLGINYVCCCKFDLSATGSGLRGTVTRSRPFSWDCGKAKNESSTYFLLGLFNERSWEDDGRYSYSFNCLPVCSSLFFVCLSSSMIYSVAHFGSLKFAPLKPIIIRVNPSRTCPVYAVRWNWADLFTDSLFFSFAVPCMPFERAELAFPCSRNESGSCPFQSLFLPSNNPLCCSALIWLRSFSAGFNTEVAVCRSGKTVKGILGTRTVTFPVQLRQ